MKRLQFYLFSLLLIAFTQESYSQNQKRYLAVIDSLEKVCSSNTYLSIDYPMHYLFRFEKLTSKEKQDLVLRIENYFAQKNYCNLYELADLLAYLLFEHEEKGNLSIRQRLMEITLDYYFYYGVAGDLRPYSKKDYTPKAKKRIKEIIQGVVNKGEEGSLRLLFSNSPTEDYLEREAKKIMRRTELQGEEIFKHLKDSIKKTDTENKINRRLANLTARDGLVIYIGRYNMKEFIPDLRANLSRIPEKHTFYIRRSLAWMGEEDQVDYIVMNFANKIGLDDMEHIKSPKLFWKFLETHYRKDIFTSEITGPDPVKIPVSTPTIEELIKYVTNLPKRKEFMYDEEKLIQYLQKEKGTRDFDDDMLRYTYQVRTERADKIYEWLMQNKDNVKFNFKKVNSQ
jgi:hypothetical protein